MNTTIDADLARSLHAYLLANEGWHNRETLRPMLGFSNRDIRIARAHAGCDKVISCTQGYKATALATDAEIKEARTMYASQRDAAQRSVGELDAVMFARHKAEIESLTAVVDALKARRPVDVYAALNKLEKVYT